GACCAENDVGLLEEPGHRFVHLDSELLEAGAVLGTVGGGGSHRECDLAGEVLLAVGPVVLEVRHEGREAGAGPRDAAFRDVDLDVYALEARSLDEEAGGFGDDLADFGVDHSVAEVNSDGDAEALDAAAAEPGLPAVLAREAEGVAWVIARCDVVPASGVADTPGDRSLHGGELAESGAGATRNAAEGTLHTNKSAIGGRDADAATAITCRSGRDEASGDGRRGATGRAGRSALEVPGVAGHAVELGGGVGDKSELG